VEYSGSLHWDAPRLWFEVRKALTCVEQVEQMELAGIGVDAWGVDYALLGERGELLQNPYHYRDRRTEGVMDDVFRRVARDQIYRATGIQFMPINTLYQLYAAQRDTPTIIPPVPTPPQNAVNPSPTCSTSSLPIPMYARIASVLLNWFV